MFEQDYLLRMFVSLAEAIRRSMQKARGDADPKSAAEMLEAAVSQATELDGSVLLSLAPESIAGVMQVSGTDPRVAEFISRSLLQEASYLREASDFGMAKIREQQAHAIAEAYGFKVELDMLTEEEWDRFFGNEEDQIEEGENSPQIP